MVAAVVFGWSQLSALNKTIPVNAKTANPPVVAPAPAVESARPAEPKIETPVVQVAVPEAEPIVPEPAAVVAETNTQTVAEEPNQEIQPVVVKAPASGFDSLKVQGVFYRTANPVAIINGKTLGIGGKINGAEVVDIEPTMVILSLDGVRKSYRVK